jgi:monovalent cation/hydrogen antiporter
MRGVIALAAALSLPQMAASKPFPQRNMIIFLTFAVILVTLVLQGLTLPALIRALGLAGSAGPNCEETEARRIMAEAALTHLERSGRDAAPEAAALLTDIKEHYRRRLSSLPHDGQPQEESDAQAYRNFLDLSLELLRVERETAVQLRNSGRINDEVLRHLLRELDLSETRYRAG